MGAEQREEVVAAVARTCRLVLPGVRRLERKPVGAVEEVAAQQLDFFHNLCVGQAHRSVAFCWDSTQARRTSAA
jgi:hypothetical protein